MPFISVVIPVYNAENTLDKCLSSVLLQTYTDYELLLINDGSLDRSREICEAYALKDKRMHTFNQVNKGVSTARNRGIEEACGRYICFIDPDDWVKPDYIKNLVEGLRESSEAGLVLQGFECYNVTGEPLPGRKFRQKLLFSDDFGQAFLSDDICRNGYVCSKLYQRDLLNKYHIRFENRINCCEDLLFMLHYMFYCDYISYGVSQEYVYIKYPESLSVKVNDFESEYACFSLYKDYLYRFAEKYALPSESMRVSYDSLMVCFRRALKTDYQPNHLTDRKNRLLHLRKLLSGNEELVGCSYDPVYKTDQVGKILLLRRCFLLYDLWISLLFRLNIKAMFLGPK